MRACYSPSMVDVVLTKHLYSFFPHLEGQRLSCEAATVAELLVALEERAPGIGFYLCDERGRLRRHVNVFVNNELIHDRRTLSDAISAGDTVHILQALSGG